MNNSPLFDYFKTSVNQSKTTCLSLNRRLDILALVEAFYQEGVTYSTLFGWLKDDIGYPIKSYFVLVHTLLPVKKAASPEFLQALAIHQSAIQPIVRSCMIPTLPITNDNH